MKRKFEINRKEGKDQICISEHHKQGTNPIHVNPKQDELLLHVTVV